MKRAALVFAGAVAVVLSATNPIPAAGQNLDNFKCYKAKDLKMPKFVPSVVSLSDQFTAAPQVTVKKPFLFCNPVDTGGGITNQVDHLTCYKIKGPKFDGPNVQVVNPLGTTKLDAKKPFLLCVPSTKTVIP